MNNDIYDGSEWKKAFDDRISKDSDGKCITVPVVTLEAGRGYEGIVKHLVHDFGGYVPLQQIPTTSGTEIKAQIPPSLIEKFEEAVKRADYISRAETQISTRIKRTVKS